MTIQDREISQFLVEGVKRDSVLVYGIISQIETRVNVDAADF